MQPNKTITLLDIAILIKFKSGTVQWKNVLMQPSQENGKGNGGKFLMNMQTNKIILKGRKVIGGIAQGEALVSKMPLMGWGNVDSENGYTVERNHPLYEVPYKGKVLV